MVDLPTIKSSLGEGIVSRKNMNSRNQEVKNPFKGLSLPTFVASKVIPIHLEALRSVEPSINWFLSSHVRPQGSHKLGAAYDIAIKGSEANGFDPLWFFTERMTLAAVDANTVIDQGGAMTKTLSRMGVVLYTIIESDHYHVQLIPREQFVQGKYSGSAPVSTGVGKYLVPKGNRVYKNSSSDFIANQGPYNKTPLLESGDGVRKGLKTLIRVSSIQRRPRKRLTGPRGLNNTNNNRSK